MSELRKIHTPKSQSSLNASALQTIEVGNNGKHISSRFIRLNFQELDFYVYVDDKAKDNITSAVKKHPTICLDHFAPVLRCVKPGMTVLDIGAHIGTFSLPCAARGATVIAVEASQTNCALLQAATTKNGLTDLTVINAIAGSSAGRANFIENGPHGMVLAGNEKDNLSSIMPVLSVDSILEQTGIGHIDILKIDVEGYEPEVLKGMQQLFRQSEPRIILYEGHGGLLARFGKNCRDLIAFFGALGYQNYRVTPDGLMKVDEKSLQFRSVVDYIAVKSLPEAIASEPQTPYPDLEELSFLAMDWCRSYDSSERTHIGRELAHGPGELLAYPATRRALNMLREDNCAEVRESVSWYRDHHQAEQAASTSLSY